MQQHHQGNVLQQHTTTTIFCSQCGTPNFYTAKFCVRCGKRFDGKPDQETRSSLSSPPSSNIADAAFTLALLFFTIGFVCYMFALLGVHELFTTPITVSLNTIEEMGSIFTDITIFFVGSVIGQAFVSLGFISLVVYIEKKK